MVQSTAKAVKMTAQAAGVIPRGLHTGSNRFKGCGLWQDKDYGPCPSDISYFDWDNKDGSRPQGSLVNHVGIVEKVENDIIYIGESNSGDSCRKRQYIIGH